MAYAASLEQGPIGVLEPPKIVDLDRLDTIPESTTPLNDLGRISGSLTLVERPDLDNSLKPDSEGCYAVLFAGSTLILANDEKGYLDTYLIRFNKEFQIQDFQKYSAAKSVKKETEDKKDKESETSEDDAPPLYVLLIDNEETEYPVGSNLPHEFCGLDDDEKNNYYDILKDYEDSKAVAKTPSGKELTGSSLEDVLHEWIYSIGTRVESFELIVEPELDVITLELPSGYANVPLS